MKTAEQLLKKLTKEYGYLITWKELLTTDYNEHDIDSIATSAMQAYAEQAVKLALEKVLKVGTVTVHNVFDPVDFWAEIDESSIRAITPASIINEIENTVKE